MEKEFDSMTSAFVQDVGITQKDVLMILVLSCVYVRHGNEVTLLIQNCRNEFLLMVLQSGTRQIGLHQVIL